MSCGRKPKNQASFATMQMRRSVSSGKGLRPLNPIKGWAFEIRHFYETGSGRPAQPGQGREPLLV